MEKCSALSNREVFFIAPLRPPFKKEKLVIQSFETRVFGGQNAPLNPFQDTQHAEAHSFYSMLTIASHFTFSQFPVLGIVKWVQGCIANESARLSFQHSVKTLGIKQKGKFKAKQPCVWGNERTQKHLLVFIYEK